MAQIDPIAAGTLGLRALGNLLSLPRQVQYQQQQAALDRALLKMAMPEKTDEELSTLVRSPALGFLSAGGEGVGRKVLGGVGDIGTMLSSLMGQPLPAMRVDPGEAGSLAALELKRKELDREEKLGGRKMPAGHLGVLVQIGLDKGLSPQEAWKWANEQYNATWQTRAQVSGGISRANQSAGIGERESTRRSGQASDVDSTIRTLRDLGVIPQGGPQQGASPSPIVPQRAPAQPPSSGVTPIAAYDVAQIPSEPVQVPYRPGYKATESTLTLPSGQVRYELEKFPKNETELVARSMGLDPNQQISDEDAMRLLMNMRKTKIGGAVAEAQALKEVWPPKTVEDTIKNTNFKRQEMTGVRINVVPKMRMAMTALSTNPFYARTLQPHLLPWTAAGALGSREEQAAAKEVQILEASRARLARMVDVGNLSGTEQDVWNPYLKGDTMTQSEMQNAIDALERDMDRMGEYYDRIISARTMEEYEAALRYQPPIAVPVDKYVPPQQSPGDPARERFESLLQQYQ